MDLDNLGSYRENNRIEAKRALGGFPHSLWETYSAFANTLGGRILLGVEEREDRTFRAVDLPDPEGLIAILWEGLNDPEKVSVNLLTERDVRIEKADGCRIVVIEVPRASRRDRPVYIAGDRYSGSYKRSGEGDYRCTAEEVDAMLRDAAAGTADMRPVAGLDVSAFRPESVRAYRNRVKALRPRTVSAAQDDETFLKEAGAVVPDETGRLRPTAAGLLLLGRPRDIREIFPNFRLEYRDGVRGTSLSSEDAGSGNLFDFWLRMNACLRKTWDDPPVRRAVREASVNALLHADYAGQGGILLTRAEDAFTAENPGTFRIRPEDAGRGGHPDPRNGLLAHLFALAGAGGETGRGLSRILRLWKRRGWGTPSVKETVRPDRTSLILPLKAEAGGIPGRSLRTAAAKERILQRLTDAAALSTRELAEDLDLPAARVRRILKELLEEGIAETVGNGRYRRYRLRY